MPMSKRMVLQLGEEHREGRKTGTAERHNGGDAIRRILDAAATKEIPAGRVREGRSVLRDSLVIVHDNDEGLQRGPGLAERPGSRAVGRRRGVL